MRNPALVELAPRPRAPLTPLQLLVLDFVRGAIRERGRPPTLREISTYLGARSRSVARHHLTALVRAGLVERDPGEARGLRVRRPAGLAFLGGID